MRILIAHSRYLSGPASGENQVVDDEARLLREAGHQVEVWDPSVNADGALEMLKAGVSTIWSAQAGSEMRRRVRDHRAEIVHVHNLFPALSPVVLRAARSEGAVVVVTLHNYRLHCLPATFLRRGRICELCLGRVPWRGVVFGCYRNSVGASAALAGSLTVHRVIGSFDMTTLYFAVSEFTRAKHVEAGMDPARVIVKQNFCRETPRRAGGGEYFLFLGRLSYEKGLDTVLRAWRPEFGKLLIAGGGDEQDSLMGMAPPEAEFLGAVTASRAREVVRKARALLLPSRSYEGAPRTVIEAYAAGVPIVASRIGGLGEMVEEGRSGFLVELEDIEGWSRAVSAMSEPDTAERLGDGAYELWQEKYNSDVALALLENGYSKALSMEK